MRLRTTKLINSAASELDKFKGLDREAARRLFSLLGDLEEIAVLAAERGDGVDGQLDDELVHRSVFYCCAELLGGRLPVCDSVGDLISWLQGIHGKESLAVLNITAENWLETIFMHLGKWDIADDLFTSVEEDEHRHVQFARDNFKKDNDIGPLVRVLERKLHRIASDPNFLYPMLWLASVEQMTSLAQELHDKHIEICGFLDVNHSEFFNEMMLCREDAESDQEPYPLELTQWRKSAFNIDLDNMGGWMEIDWKWSTAPVDVEARFLRAIRRTFDKQPELERTFNADRREVYHPRETIIGVRRRTGDSIPSVYTVYIKNPSESLESIKRYTRMLDRRKRATGYHVIPENIKDLQKIAPAPRCGTNLTVLLGAGGIDWGFAPLVPYEGNCWSVGVPGAFRERTSLGRTHRTLTVGVLGDHRVTDGFELGQFMQGIRGNLED